MAHECDMITTVKKANIFTLFLTDYISEIHKQKNTHNGSNIYLFAS